MWSSTYANNEVIKENRCDPFLLASMRFSVSKKDSLNFHFDVVFKERIRHGIEGRVRNVKKRNNVLDVYRLVKGTEISTEVEIRVC